MSSEVSHNVSSHFEEELQALSYHVEAVLELISSHVDFRDFLRLFVNNLDSICANLSSVSQYGMVSQETAGVLDDLEHALKDVADILYVVHEIYDIPDEVIRPVHIIGIAVGYTLLEKFQEITEVMGFAVDTNSRLKELLDSTEIPELYSYVFELEDITQDPDTCYTRLSSAVQELREILHNANEAHEVNPEESAVNDEPAVSQEDIESNSLSYKYKKVRRNEDGSVIEEECVICISNLEEDDDARRLRCLHIFHTACADKWLLEEPKCPVCRLDIGEVVDGFPSESKVEE